MIELTPEQYTAMKQQELVNLCNKLVSIEETKVSDQRNERLFAVALNLYVHWQDKDIQPAHSFNLAEKFLKEHYKRIGQEV